MIKKIGLLLTIMLLVHGMSMAQGQPDESTTKTLEFLQGDGLYDSGMMYILKQMKETVWNRFGLFINDAKVLAAIFMIIFFAIRSYEMMAGDKKMEIMPLMRPFGLAMIILWWGPFTKMVAFPTKVVAQTTEQQFESQQKLVNKERVLRADLMIKMADQLYTFQAQTQVAEKESDTWYGQAWNSATSTVKEGVSTVISPLLELKARLQIGSQLLLTQLLELGSIWLLRIAVYCIFLIEIIYSTILIILGPFAVAASILPAYRDSFSTWVARFVSVNLYSGIAYLIMYLCGLVQEFVLKVEVGKYHDLLGDNGTGAKLETMAVFAGNGILSFGTVILVFVMTAACMFTVPSISTWIISTSGITSAATTFGRSAQTVTHQVKQVAGKLL